jgi:hypothetical protein
MSVAGSQHSLSISRPSLSKCRHRNEACWSCPMTSTMCRPNPHSGVPHLVFRRNVVVLSQTSLLPFPSLAEINARPYGCYFDHTHQCRHTCAVVRLNQLLLFGIEMESALQQPLTFIAERIGCWQATSSPFESVVNGVAVVWPIELLNRGLAPFVGKAGNKTVRCTYPIVNMAEAFSIGRRHEPFL